MSHVSLVRYLDWLDAAELAELLRARPELADPDLRDLGELARRAARPEIARWAVERVDQDAYAVAQAIDLLGDRASLGTIARLLGADPGLVDAALTRLRTLALAWPSEDGRLVLAEALRSRWSQPLRLGRPAEVLLAEWPDDRLADLARRLGLRASAPTRDEAVQAIAARLADRAFVRSVIDDLPPGTANFLEFVAETSPRVKLGGHRGWGSVESDSPPAVLIRAGLLLPAEQDAVAELPAEVGLTLRRMPEEFPLTGPPDLPTRKAADVRRACAPAMQTALAAVTQLLDDASRHPIAELSTGGVGKRERMRLAKSLGCTEAEVVLWIDIAYTGRLLGRVRAGYVPTIGFDRWRDQSPARRWTYLASAWMFMLEHAPTTRRLVTEDRLDKPEPPPLRVRYSVAGACRRALFRVLAGDGGGTVPDLDHAVATLPWYAPLSACPTERIVAYGRAAVEEAQWLGLLAGGLLAPAGRALVAHDREAAVRSVEAHLPQRKATLHLQSDLTAVVVGEPTPQMHRLLEKAADAESKGTVRTWRFSAESLRKAFDRGLVPDELLTGLAEAASAEVPQPLAYLIKDVARQHGNIQVLSPRGCCLVTDEALAAEIMATDSLRTLTLRRIAPTVLLSDLPAATTLERLRAAGFAPVGEKTTTLEELFGPVSEEFRARKSEAPPLVYPRTSVSPESVAAKLTRKKR